jgi:hypothetical protein
VPLLASPRASNERLHAAGERTRVPGGVDDWFRSFDDEPAMHMIEEYARHNGHADLIRERIDGAVGD